MHRCGLHYRLHPRLVAPRTVLVRTRYIGIGLEEERKAAEAVLEERLVQMQSHESASSSFVDFCREQKQLQRAGGPSEEERKAAEAALERRLGPRDLSRDTTSWGNSWRTRGWVMGVPPLSSAGQPATSSTSTEPAAAATAAETTRAEAQRAPPSRREERRRALAEFDFTPRQLKARLDEVVIAQDEAKRALSVAVCNHFKFVQVPTPLGQPACATCATCATCPTLHLHLRQRCLARPEEAERHHLKPNVLLLGPSGVGKTHLMRAAARLLGVPFVRADATRFSATGYVGADAEDMVRGLLQAADGDVGLAEYGIVYAHLVDRAVHPA